MSDSDQHDETIEEKPSTEGLDDQVERLLEGQTNVTAGGGMSVLASLGKSLPDVPRVLLRDSGSGENEPVVMPNSPEVPGSEHQGKYLLLGEIARGGMGAILRGRDTDLGRDLAVKVLLEEHQNTAEAVQRFIEEAQIGGQLQHPGIVPVYELGQFGGRRPYFTMKLVKGKTLAKLLSERAAPDQDRARFLGILERVSQTIAYAHARGVIHRDLKPSNIMVGAFGEVQVMDWGLAKVLAEGGLADEKKPEKPPPDRSVIRTLRGKGSGTRGGSDVTEAGTVMGTPAYMSPEQARGKVDELDERCDVFGLGAILCEILTGQPPYAGRDSTKVYHRAAAGDVSQATALLEACSADQELVALAKWCLEPEPADRPRDAGVVAAAISAHLQSVEARLREAEVESARAAARAVEERKRRRVSLALAVSVLITVVVGAGGWVWNKQQAMKLEEQRARRHQQVNSALLRAKSQIEAFSGDLDDQVPLAKALAAGRQANSLLSTGPADPELRKRVDTLLVELSEKERELTGQLKDRQLLVALEKARLAKAETDARESHYITQKSLPIVRDALREYGLPIGAVGPAQAASHMERRPAAVQDALLAALDDFLDLWRPLGIRWSKSAAETRIDWVLPESAAAKTGLKPRDRLVGVQGGQDGVIRDIGEMSVTAIYELLRGEPGTVVRLKVLPQGASENRVVAIPRDDTRQWVEDVIQRADSDPWRRQVRAAMKEPRSWKRRVALLNLAQSSEVRGQPPWAITLFAARLRRAGAPAEALDFLKRAQVDYPSDFWVNQSIGYYSAKLNPPRREDAIRYMTVAVSLRPDSAGTRLNLGWVLPSDRRYLQEDAYQNRKAIELEPSYAGAYNNLGGVLKREGKLEEAAKAYRRAIELNPNDALPRRNLGSLLDDQGKLDEAIEYLRQAIALNSGDSYAYRLLGIVLSKQDKLDEAITAYRKAIQIKPDYSHAYYNLANALREQEKLDEAIAAYRKAIELKPDYSFAYTNLGNVLRVQGKPDAAIAHFRRAIEADRQNVVAYNNLARALKARGDVDEAIATYYRLASATRAAGNLAEAIAAYRKIIELKPGDPVVYLQLGGALRSGNRLEDAIAAYRTAIRLRPEYAAAYHSLGSALGAQEKHDEAIAAYRKALELDPKRVPAYVNLSFRLVAQNKLEEAIAALVTATEVAPDYLSGHYNLGRRLQENGQFAEALESFRRAHELWLARPSSNVSTSRRIEEVEELIEWEKKLPAILSKESKPANWGEAYQYARVCSYKKLYHAAMRLYADGFAKDPKLAEDPRRGRRTTAANYAAMAASGQGDGTELDDAQRARLRQRALGWLRDELADLTWLLHNGQQSDRTFVTSTLRRWQRSDELRGIRDVDALSKLPVEERGLIQRFWGDVAELLKQTVEERSKS